jgi:hypothetical protein
MGRVVSLSYTNNKLQKLIYNTHEIEYSYSNGCLAWTEDFLDNGDGKRIKKMIPFRIMKPPSQSIQENI